MPAHPCAPAKGRAHTFESIFGTRADEPKRKHRRSFGLFFGVLPYPLVDGEQRGPLETLSTLGAAVGSLPGVIPHVVLEPRRPFEGFSAL